MPDEKPSIFEELAVRPAERPKEEAKTEPVENPELLVIKAALEKERSEKSLLEEKLAKQNRARADERRQNKENLAKLKELEKTTPKEEDGEDEIEEEDESVEKPVSKEPIPDLEKVVEKKLFEKSVIDSIKARAKFRDEAEVIKAYVDKMIAGGLSSGDPEADVDTAYALFERNMNKRSFSMPSPTSSSGGTMKEDRPGDIPKSVLKAGKELYGHDEEDFKKYSGEIEIKPSRR